MGLFTQQPFQSDHHLVLLLEHPLVERDFFFVKLDQFVDGIVLKSRIITHQTLGMMESARDDINRPLFVEILECLHRNP